MEKDYEKEWQEREERRKKFWDQIDITPANKFISELVGFPVNMVKKEQQVRGEMYYGLMDDTNIIDKAGKVVQAAWQAMTIGTFSANVSVDKDTHKIWFWGNVSLHYHHHGGGTNGAEIATIYFEDGVWKAEKKSDRQLIVL